MVGARGRAYEDQVAAAMSGGGVVGEAAASVTDSAPPLVGRARAVVGGRGYLGKGGQVCVSYLRECG